MTEIQAEPSPLRQLRSLHLAPGALRRSERIELQSGAISSPGAPLPIGFTSAPTCALRVLIIRHHDDTNDPTCKSALDTLNRMKEPLHIYNGWETDLWHSYVVRSAVQ